LFFQFDHFTIRFLSLSLSLSLSLYLSLTHTHIGLNSFFCLPEYGDSKLSRKHSNIHLMHKTYCKTYYLYKIIKTWWIRFEKKYIVRIEKMGRATRLAHEKRPSCFGDMCGLLRCRRFVFYSGVKTISASSIWWWDVCPRHSNDESLTTFFFL